MRVARNRDKVSQIPLPGMPAQVATHPAVSCCNVAEGQEVLYVGKVSGGPSYGSRGQVKETLQRVAVVDIGTGETWRIPYYLLAVPEAA